MFYKPVYDQQNRLARLIINPDGHGDKIVRAHQGDDASRKMVVSALYAADGFYHKGYYIGEYGLHLYTSRVVVKDTAENIGYIAAWYQGGDRPVPAYNWAPLLGTGESSFLGTFRNPKHEISVLHKHNFIDMFLLNKKVEIWTYAIQALALKVLQAWEEVEEIVDGILVDEVMTIDA